MLAGLLLVACDNGRPSAAPRDAVRAQPSPPRPSAVEMAALGRHLFFDRGLSASGRQSCADCHDPGHAFAPGNTLAVPQQSTYDLQDKVYVYILGDSNKVMSQPIGISGQTTAYYLVNKGLQPGQKIVFAGMDRLHDGAVIQPQVLSADSIRKAMPL